MQLTGENKVEYLSNRGYINIYSVSEIGGQTLIAYYTWRKDEKSHINMDPEMLPLQVTYMGELMETAEKLNVSIKKSFLKGDVLVKISLVRSIADLRKQDLSYLIQLIKDETET